MTILDKMKNGADAHEKTSQKAKQDAGKKAEYQQVESSMAELTNVETKFKEILDEFRANSGFSVNTGEQPYDTMIELLSSKGVNASIAVLLSFIRYCVNHNIKKDITVKIGYNKPASIPMNFAVNEEILEDIYPGDVVEIN